MTDSQAEQPAQERIEEMERIIRDLQMKILRLQREKGIQSTKSRLYAEQVERSHRRELAQENLVAELVERQHELNIMLNRSNVMLARAQEATAMLSIEFGELARALPEPGAFDTEAPAVEQIEDRVQRINSLFKKTGSLSEEIAETLTRNAGLDGDSGKPSKDQPSHEQSPAPPESPSRADSSTMESNGHSEPSASVQDVDESETPREEMPAPPRSAAPQETLETPRRPRELFSRPRATPTPRQDPSPPPTETGEEALDAVIVDMDQSAARTVEQQGSFIGRIRDMLFP